MFNNMMDDLETYFNQTRSAWEQEAYANYTQYTRPFVILCQHPIVPKNYNPDDHSTIPSNMKNLFDPNINPNVNDWWQQARNWVARRDPLVLDLDGDGIETVGISATTHILFDHNNDGIATGTGWVKGDDGLLVLDRNGNGVIDNGSELFGDSTTVNGVKATDGFSALRAEDTNARHPEFNSGSNTKNEDLFSSYWCEVKTSLPIKSLNFKIQKKAA